MFSEPLGLSGTELLLEPRLYHRTEHTGEVFEPFWSVGVRGRSPAGVGLRFEGVGSSPFLARAHRKPVS